MVVNNVGEPKMAAQTTAELVLELRDRVGDNITDNYLFTDSQWTNMIKTAERKLPGIVSIEDEVVIAGDGSQEYDIPATAINVNWSQVYHRTGTDHSSDIKLKAYQTNAGVIYSPISIGTGESIVIWISRPFIVGTDELDDNSIEVLYKLCEIEYINSCCVRRADYAQWASLNRSDASINQLIILKQDLKRDLSDMTKTMGSGSDVSDFCNW